MKTQNRQLRYRTFLPLRIAMVVAVMSLFIVGSAFPGLRKLVLADATCSSITDCQQQISNANGLLAALKDEATSYRDAINKLQSQIASLQQQISINQAAQTHLQAEIDSNQAELNQEKKVLGEDLKAMYVGGQMSTVEMLATSKDLSSFIDAATYSSAVQNKIQNTLHQITDLQNELRFQKVQVDQLLADEQTQQNQVTTAQSQQQELLTYNQSKQEQYNNQVAQNQQRLDALIAAQRAANNDLSASYYFIRFPGSVQQDPLNGSYPYAGSPFSMSTAPGCVDGDGPDQWGYCTRQCVSYTAWAVAYSGRSAPYFWGNAKDWVAAAYRAGVPVYTSGPQPGDVAISTAGTWGHAMYVEKVSGNQIYVSQYNQQLTGQFSTQWRNW